MRVAVAVIFDKEGRVLLTQRPLHTSHGGLWEFPGGKLYDHETPVDALIREVEEEVGLKVLSANHLTDIYHDYVKKQVILHVYQVEKFLGEPKIQEDQLNLKWVDVSELANYEFPAANSEIISHLYNSRKSN